MNRLFTLVLTALVFVSGSAFAGCKSCKKSTTKTTQGRQGRLSPRVAVRSAALHKIRGKKTVKIVSRRSYRSVGKSRTAGARKSVSTPVVPPAPNALGRFIMSQMAKRQCTDGSCKR